MALITEIRKNVTESTPLMAVVGATDYAVERVRTAASNAGHFQEEIERAIAQLETLPREWQTRLRELDAKTVQQAPVLVVHRAMEMATRMEESYERLAERGKVLLERASHTAPAQEFVKQGKVTLSRTRAAVTTARKALDDSTAAARGVITIGRREAGEVVTAVEAEVADSVAATEKVVAERTRGTRAAVQGVATTVRKRAVSTRTATRSAASSARRTARKAVEAVEAVAAQIGEDQPVAVPVALPVEKPAAKRTAKRAVRPAKAVAKPEPEAVKAAAPVEVEAPVEAPVEALVEAPTAPDDAAE
jgi:DNA-binding protein HU-beta